MGLRNNNNNSGILAHWQSEHGVGKDGKLIPKPGTITEQLKDQAMKANSTKSLYWARDFELFKSLFIRWIVYCHIAFLQLENSYFRELLAYLNSYVEALIPGHRTIRKWVLYEFHK